MFEFSAPTKAPGNISIDSYIGHNLLEVNWGHIASEYLHGDLKGYKVTYTLAKTGVTTIIAAAKYKIVHPSLTKVTLTNLQPNSVYAVMVLAFNDEGDGVQSSSYSGCKYNVVLLVSVIFWLTMFGIH